MNINDVEVAGRVVLQDVVNILKPMKVEWMVTKKCNLRCEYCVVPNYPVEELSFDRKKEVLDILKRFKVGTILMYGGEVTQLGRELIDLLKYANSLDQFCVVLTNGIRLNTDKKYFEELAEVTKNLTVSVDWLPENADKADTVKTAIGWKVITSDIAKNIPDRVVGATMYRQNALEIPKIVRRATSEGIWTALCVLNVGKKGFRFSGPCSDIKFNPEDQKVLNDVCDELIDMKKSGKYLIHEEINVFRAWKQWGIPQNFHCTKFTGFAIDADGRVPCCKDWYGDNPKTIFDIENDQKGFLEWLDNNVWDCKGCCWTPTILMESYDSLEEGNKKLSHGFYKGDSK